MHRGAYRAGTVKTKWKAERQLKYGNTYISHAYAPMQSPSYQACTRLCTAHSHFAKGDCRLPRPRGNVVTALWQRCYDPVATLLRPRGNVVMAPWQRCYGPVATLIWARGNVDMGPWQRTNLCTNTYKLYKRGNKGLKIAQRDGGSERANWFHPPRSSLYF